MNAGGSRRGIMVLISGTDCIFSHTARIVLNEKGVEYEHRFVSEQTDPSVLADLNPYLETPTLIDRDMVLYDVSLVCEYLDERLPHPPLLAVDPAGRAGQRLMIHRLRRDWLNLLYALRGDYDALSDDDRRLIRDGLTSISHHFRDNPFLSGSDYGLADSFMAPLLWRLARLGIKLPKPAMPLKEYAERLFNRKAFAQSLTEAEKALH